MPETITYQIKVTRFNLPKMEGSLQAFATIQLNQFIQISGVRIFKNKKEGTLFVSFPQQKSELGEYYDLVKSLDANFDRELQEQVLNQYSEFQRTLKNG